jgi:nitrogen regulatory protein PII
MKRIEGFLAPHRLTPVIHKLHELPRFPGLTIVNAHGQGHGRGEGGHFAYDKDCLTYLDRKLLIVICEDAEASAIAELIATVAHTGNRADGIVVISDASQVIRIREVTGQRDPDGRNGTKVGRGTRGQRAKRGGGA